jgi:hypothetical protein
MTDQQNTNPSETGQPAGSQNTNEAWQEVGRQFQALGESLATAIQAAWQNEEVRRQAQGMKTGLEAMVNDVGQAIKETASSPKAQSVKAEAVKTAESFRTAGEETVQEVRPHLVAALQTLNEELQKLIGRLQGSKPEQGSEPNSEEK